jgi:predicted CopG family antitoxin
MGKTIQVKVQDDVYERLLAEVSASGLTISQVVRRYLDAPMVMKEGRPAAEVDIFASKSPNVRSSSIVVKATRPVEEATLPNELTSDFSVNQDRWS